MKDILKVIEVWRAAEEALNLSSEAGSYTSGVHDGSIKVLKNVEELLSIRLNETDAARPFAKPTSKEIGEWLQELSTTQPKEDELYNWTCQALHGGKGSCLYIPDGMCQHPECHPDNDDRKGECQE